MLRASSLALTSAVACCCPSTQTPPPLKPPLPAASSASFDGQSPSTAAVPVARMTLVVVFDQLAGWVLAEYADHLHPDGLVRQVMARGVYARRSAYPYASTNTAPGHAHIFTGATPAENGIYANKVIHPQRGEIDLVDDGEHAIYGLEHKFASPSMLRVPTVGDALQAQRGEQAQVVALSLKDRASVLPGGKKADVVMWYERKLPGFTTSSYYGPLPGWANDWFAAHPLEALLTPWTPVDPNRMERLIGPDEGPGEGDLGGFGTVFPHDPKASKDPYSVLRITPQMSGYLVDLAAEASKQMKLGEDDVPDLLSVSISGTDYAGHTFGPNSWEFFDQLYRADQRLGAFYAELSEKTDVAVLITSDHGVHPVPDRSGKPRIFPDAVAGAAQKAAVGVLGPGEWVADYSKPLIYFSDALIVHPKREAAITAMLDAVTRLDGIAAVYDVADVRTWREDPDPTRRLIGQSVVDGERGELYVLVEEGAIVDEDKPHGKGTTHGTPYDRDREVPVLFAGPGVSPRRINERVSQAQVAPTIAALLGIDPPAGATAAPLPGSPSRP